MMRSANAGLSGSKRENGTPPSKPFCASASTTSAALPGTRIVNSLKNVSLSTATPGTDSSAAAAVALAAALESVPGVAVLNETFFNEFTIRVPGNAAEVVEALAQKGLLGGVPFSRFEPDNPAFADLIIVAATEVNTLEDRAAYAAALREVLA